MTYSSRVMTIISSLEMNLKILLLKTEKLRKDEDLGCSIQLWLIEKRVFEKVVFYVNKGNIMYISSRV